MSKLRSTLLPKTATMSNEFCVEIMSFRQSRMLLRLCCFDIVANVDRALKCFFSHVWKTESGWQAIHYFKYANYVRSSALFLLTFRDHSTDWLSLSSYGRFLRYREYPSEAMLKSFQHYLVFVLLWGLHTRLINILGEVWIWLGSFVIHAPTSLIVILCHLWLWSERNDVGKHCRIIYELTCGLPAQCVRGARPV